MKRILWLVNIPLPEASILMGESPIPFAGWLVNSSKMLAATSDVRLFIAFPKKKFKGCTRISGEAIEYLPFERLRQKNFLGNNSHFNQILDITNPDLVHIHGTEYLHTLAMINLCGVRGIKTVVSIQGLLSITAQHFYASLPAKAIYGFTLRNIFNKDSVYLDRKSFARWGDFEISALKKNANVIGRTTWDKANLLQINPEVNYFFCNEILRESFYEYKWDLESCEDHTIFLSQGRDSYKGLHHVVEALPLVLQQFPDTKVYVAGVDITDSSTMKAKLLGTHYGKYIRKRIRKLKLQDYFFFTGLLDECEMCERYLRSHVFVCPSSIENSPNSLGEAMILGVPCVASYVGGIPDMLEHEKEGFLYQGDAPYMLAHYICELFLNNKVALEFSKAARESAKKRHCKDKNMKQLLKIYDSLGELKLK